MSNDDQYLSNLGKTLSITANNILQSNNLNDIILSPRGNYRKILNNTMSNNDTRQAVQNNYNSYGKFNRTNKYLKSNKNKPNDIKVNGFQDISQINPIDYFKNPYIDVKKTFKLLTHISDEMLNDIDIDKTNKYNKLIKDSTDLNSNLNNEINEQEPTNPSLYQGFETLLRETFPENQDNSYKDLRIEDANKKSKQIEPSPRKRSLKNSSLLNFDADIVSRSYSITFLKNIKAKVFNDLSILKMKKKITTVEINEIDFKLQKLEMRRNLMFNKLADLENKEILLEQKIPLADERINFLRDRQDMDSLVIDNDNHNNNYINPNMKNIINNTREGYKGQDNYENGDEDDSIVSNLNNNNNNFVNDVNTGTPFTTSLSNRSSTSFKSALFDNSSISYSINNSILSQNDTNNNFSTKSLKKLRNFLQSNTKKYEKTTPTLQQYYKHGSLIKTIDNAHINKVSCLDFDIPFGTVCSTDNIVPDIKLWDLSDSKQIGILKGHSSKINCLEFDNNFNMLITGSDDSSLKLWDINKCISYFNQDMNLFDFGCLYTFDEHVAGITAININTHYILSGSNDLTVRQWDLESGKCVQTLDLMFTTSSDINNLNSYTHDANRHDIPIVGGLQSFDAALATGTKDGIVRLWDLRNGEMVRTLEGHTDAISCLKFDLQNIITGSLDQTVRTWDLRSGLSTNVLNLDSPISSIDFDDKNLVVARHSNYIDVFNRSTNELTSFDNFESRAEVVKYKNGYLVEGRTDGKINSWAI